MQIDPSSSSSASGNITINTSSVSSTSTNVTAANYADIPMRSNNAAVKSSKILPSAYRRELSSNMSYDETKTMVTMAATTTTPSTTTTKSNISFHPAVVVPEIATHPDPFNNINHNNNNSEYSACSACPNDFFFNVTYPFAQTI